MIAGAAVPDGYGAKAHCDWQGNYWDEVVVYKNDHELMFDNAINGYPVGGMLFPQFLKLSSLDGGGGAAAKPEPKPTVALPPWYIPELNGQRAAELLVPLPAGTFVARNADNRGMQAISIHLGGGDVSHILCVQSPKPEGGVGVQLGQDGKHRFNSLRGMVGYYIANPPANPRTGQPLAFIPYSP